MSVLPNPLPSGVQIRRLSDFVSGASAATSDVGETVNASKTEIQAMFAGATAADGSVTLSAEQATAILALFDALDAKALVAHEAVTDIAEVYSEGVR